MPTPTPTPTPVDVIMPAPGAAELGFKTPLLSIELDQNLSFLDDDTFTFVDEATRTATTLDIVEMRYDGTELWRHTIDVPAGSVPTLSVDHGSGVTAIWFSPEGPSGDYLNGLRPVSSDITWFEPGTGTQHTMVVQRDGGQPRSSSMMVGYHFFPDGAGEAPSAWFIQLGAGKTEERIERAAIGNAFEVYGIWGGQYFGVIGDDSIAAQPGILQEMAAGVYYNFMIQPNYFSIQSENGDVVIYGPGYTKVSEGSNACGANSWHRALVLDRLAISAMVYDVKTGNIQCVNVPAEFGLSTAAPDDYVLAQYIQGDQQIPLLPTKLGRIGSDTWIDLPDGTVPIFAPTYTRFVTQYEPGTWGRAVLTSYETSEFAPPAI